MYSCGIYESKWHVRRLRRNFINIRYLAEVLCRMFPFFPLGGNTEIVNQSHKVGGLPSTTCKTFLPGKFIPTHCFRRHLFFDFFRYYNCTSSRTIHCFSIPLVLVPHILREDELATYPQGGWALEQFFVLLLLWWLSGKVIGLFLNSSLYYTLRFGMPSLWGLLPQYPQGGWARYISSVRMSSRSEFCSLYNNFYVGCFHNILKEDELVTYPQ